MEEVYIFNNVQLIIDRLRYCLVIDMIRISQFFAVADMILIYKFDLVPL
jgi:hypothetical protein